HPHYTAPSTLKVNLVVMVAPEDSLNDPRIIGAIEIRPFRVPMDLGYPIVPVYFDGNRELSHGGSLVTKPGTLTAHIHPPIETADWNLDNLEEKIIGVRTNYLDWAEVKNDSVSPLG